MMEAPVWKVIRRRIIPAPRVNSESVVRSAPVEQNDRHVVLERARARPLGEIVDDAVGRPLERHVEPRREALAEPFDAELLAIRPADLLGDAIGKEAEPVAGTELEEAVL